MPFPMKGNRLLCQSELQKDQPDLFTSDPQQASKPGRADLGRGTSRFQMTEQYHGTYIQLEAIGGKAPATSKGALSYFIDKVTDRIGASLRM